MGGVIGEILPLALGVAISPMPVIAAILMLLSPKARTTSVGFLVGWVAGIVIAVTAITLLSSLLPEGDPNASKPVQGTIKLVLGILLVLSGKSRHHVDVAVHGLRVGTDQVCGLNQGLSLVALGELPRSASIAACA